MCHQDSTAKSGRQQKRRNRPDSGPAGLDRLPVGPLSVGAPGGPGADAAGLPARARTAGAGQETGPVPLCEPWKCDYCAKAKGCPKRAAGGDSEPLAATPGAAGALGRSCENVSPPPPLERARADRWRLQDQAGDIMPGHRVSSCLRRRVAMAPAVRVVRRETRSSRGREVGYSGLQTCGSVWDCPMCSWRVSQVRRSEMQQALEAGRAQGLVVYLATFTVRHSSREGVRIIADALGKAIRLLCKRPTWRKWAARVGLVGTVRAVEVTQGDNGWHVHAHTLTFLERELAEGDEERLREAWVSAVSTVEAALGLAPGTITPLPHIGLRIHRGDEADKYVTKWGVADELVPSPDGKGSTKNRTPWGLLRDSLTAATVEAREEAAALFAEYSSAMFGRHQLQWSKGLKRRLGIKADGRSDGDIAADQVATGEVLAEIGRELWRFICGRHFRGDVLRTFRADVGAGVALLEELGREVPSHSHDSPAWSSPNRDLSCCNETSGADQVPGVQPPPRENNEDDDSTDGYPWA